MENFIKMDDLGVPPFKETPTCFFWNSPALFSTPWFNRLPLKILTSFQMDGGGGGFKDLLFHPFHQVTISGGFGLVVWVFLITLSGLGDPQIASAMLISVDDPIDLRNLFFQMGKNTQQLETPLVTPLRRPKNRPNISEKWCFASRPSGTQNLGPNYLEDHPKVSG